MKGLEKYALEWSATVVHELGHAFADLALKLDLEKIWVKKDLWGDISGGTELRDWVPDEQIHEYLIAALAGPITEDLWRKKYGHPPTPQKAWDGDLKNFRKAAKGNQINKKKIEKDAQKLAEAQLSKVEKHAPLLARKKSLAASDLRR